MQSVKSHFTAPIHNPKMGRDRILKKILKNNLPPTLVIIDYERGVSRKYLEKQFDFVDTIDNTILIGKSRKIPNKIAVIFDPDIEWGFLCKKTRDLCSNRQYYEMIKSNRACNVLERYISQGQVQNVLSTIADKLIEIFNQIQ